jgi:hypothetical protein
LNPEYAVTVVLPCGSVTSAAMYLPARFGSMITCDAAQVPGRLRGVSPFDESDAAGDFAAPPPGPGSPQGSAVSRGVAGVPEQPARIASAEAKSERMALCDALGVPRSRSGRALAGAPAS